MRHRRKGRVLGRSPSHQRALLRSLASALILTERDTEFEDPALAPKVKGRIITTLQKAKEVRPLVEKSITLACKSNDLRKTAQAHGTDAARNTEAWRAWRKSEKYKTWNKSVAPAVAIQRRVLNMLGNKQAVKVLFDVVAPRFADRAGGYTRIMRLAKPRLGDAGTRAVIEFVGVRDRQAAKAQAPAFEKEGGEGAE